MFLHTFGEKLKKHLIIAFPYILGEFAPILNSLNLEKNKKKHQKIAFSHFYQLFFKNLQFSHYKQLVILFSYILGEFAPILNSVT